MSRGWKYVKCHPWVSLMTKLSVRTLLLSCDPEPLLTAWWVQTFDCLDIQQRRKPYLTGWSHYWNCKRILSGSRKVSLNLNNSQCFITFFVSLCKAKSPVSWSSSKHSCECAFKRNLNIQCHTAERCFLSLCALIIHIKLKAILTLTSLAT